MLNILMLSALEGNGFVSLNSSGLPVLKKEGKRDVVLHTESVTSMDGEMTGETSIDLFLTTASGMLLYIKYDGEKNAVYPVMVTRDKNSKIQKVRVICLNGRYHLFYCLDGETRCLVHRVAEGTALQEPEIVGNVSRRFAYDVALDEDMNIHVAFADSKGTLVCRRYVNSQKSFTDAHSVCSCDAAKLSLCISRDRLFAAYTESDGNGYGVYVVSVLDSFVKKTSFLVSGRAELCFNRNENSQVLHIVDDGNCFEIKCNSNLNVEKGVLKGRSAGICKIKNTGSKYSGIRYPADKSYRPFAGIENVVPSALVSQTAMQPRGHNAEIFAEKNKDVFRDKILELREENLFGSLERIEASLCNLTSLCNKVYEKICVTEEKGSEYNDTQDQKEEF